MNVSYGSNLLSLRELLVTSMNVHKYSSKAYRKIAPSAPKGGCNFDRYENVVYISIVIFCYGGTYCPKYTKYSIFEHFLNQKVWRSTCEPQKPNRTKVNKNLDLKDLQISPRNITSKRGRERRRTLYVVRWHVVFIKIMNFLVLDKLVRAELQIITIRATWTINNEYQRWKIDRVASHLKYRRTYVRTSRHSLRSILYDLLWSPGTWRRPHRHRPYQHRNLISRQGTGYPSLLWNLGLRSRWDKIQIRYGEEEEEQDRTQSSSRQRYVGSFQQRLKNINDDSERCRRENMKNNWSL